jgi:hypothetical protein
MLPPRLSHFMAFRESIYVADKQQYHTPTDTLTENSIVLDPLLCFSSSSGKVLEPK